MRKFFTFLSACCAIVIIAWQIAPDRSHWRLRLDHRTGEKIVETARLPRPVYRFSVIPGGAYSAEELASARRSDAVVGVHYADFHSSGVALGRLGRDSYMYVSYRKGNRVYWTVKKHRIPKGEPVLSDGAHLARARCGNRLSLTPMLPTLPGLQLPEEAFNAPEPPIELPTSPLLSPAYDGPDLPLAFVLPRIQSFPSLPGTQVPGLATPIPGFFGPIIPPIGIAGTTRPTTSGGGVSGGATGPITGTGGGGGLGSVPEPSTLSLIALCTVLFALWAGHSFRRSRRH